MSSAPMCPFCDSATVELVSQWGGQIITSQWRCEVCGSYFEALREDFDDMLEGDQRKLGIPVDCVMADPLRGQQAHLAERVVKPLRTA